MLPIKCSVCGVKDAKYKTWSNCIKELVALDLETDWLMAWQGFPVKLEGDPLFICSIICDKEWRMKNQK